MEERSNVLNLIIERLNAMLGAGEYNEETKYADIGMKSGNYSAMITLLEDEFDVEIPSCSSVASSPSVSPWTMSASCWTSNLRRS